MGIRNRITRREFLKGTGIAALGMLLGRCTIASVERTTPAESPTLTPEASLRAQNLTPTPMASRPTVPKSEPTPIPTVTHTPTPRGPYVVHARAPDATSWDFSAGWYGDHVGQEVVDEMVERGLMQLTGTTSLAAAWSAMLPDYQPGQKIAIKVNFNNSGRDDGTCSQQGHRIDALPQPVLALVRGLVEEWGVEPGDIWMYDATARKGRLLPDRFRLPILAAYPGVQFWGQRTCAGVQQASFNHVDESLRVSFSHPALTDRWLPDLLYQATYLINVPILKKHGIHPVTLGFKNHFGSLDNIIRAGEDNLHYYIAPQDSRYSPDYSPLVDIYANPNIAGKTVLTVGDGLFGAPGATQPPARWSTFGNDAPSSLFFSRDPVAVDCVMCDLLDAEWGLDDAAYDYLRLAAERGLGVFERGDPWGSGYSHIDYRYIEL